MATEPAALRGLARGRGRPAAVLRYSRRRLKVLFLVDCIERESDGETGRQLLQRVALAKRAGVAPQICVLRDTLWLTAATAGCPVRHYDIGCVNQGNSAKQLADLVRWMWSHRFGILQTMMADSCLYGPVLGKLAGIPVIIGIRSDRHLFVPPQTLRGRLLLRTSNHLLREVQANSAFAAAHAIRTEGIHPDRIAVVYGGVPGEEVRARLTRREEIRLKFGVSRDEILVSRLSGTPDAGSDEAFLDAARVALDRNPRLRFTVAGAGGREAELEALIRSRRLERVVTLADPEEESIGDWIAATDIALQCSDAERFSHSLLQYMAAGLPIIATETASNREALGEAGILVPCGDTQRLADAICILTRPEERQFFGSAALKAAERFDIQRAEEQARNLYARYAAWAYGERLEAQP